MLSPKGKIFWVAFPLLVTAGSILGVGMLRRNPAPNSIQPTTESAPPAQPQVVTIPARTELAVRLDQSIASNRVTSGDPFYATVAESVVIDGQTVIPRGAPVKGRVVSVHESGKLHGVAQLGLALESVEIGGNHYDLRSSTYGRSGRNHKKRNWEMIGGGAGGGALIGALAGGGKGALIGAPLGAGAGVGGAALTGKKDFVIPAETRINFELTAPVDVQLRS